MASHSLRILVLGLAPIALTACVETEAATAQPTSAVPAIGVDLGRSSRVPHIAALAGEGEGYGRTEPGATPTMHGSMSHGGMQMEHGSMPGMTHGTTGGMEHGLMPGMTHGSTGGMPMHHGSMPGMSHGSMSGMQMPHGAMPGMSHSSKQKMAVDHGSMPGMSHSPGGGMKMAHSGHTHAQGTGTVNSIDAAGRKINLSHGPISAVGWPAMTMDFAVAPSVDLQAVKPGTRVNFTIEQGEGGMYVIQSITPAGGRRK